MAWVPLVNIPIQLQNVNSVNMSGGTLEFYLSGTTTPTALASDNTGTSIGTSITLNSSGYPESGGNPITLFRDSAVALKIVCKDSSGTTLWTSDGLQDALVLLASVANALGASLVGIEDSAGHYTSSTVEGALLELGANTLKQTESKAGITAIYTFASGGQINMADMIISRPLLGDYAVRHAVVTQTTATPDFDIAATGCNSFVMTLTENASPTVSNASPTGTFCQINIKLIQDGAGGAYTVTWPASFKWPGGTAPTMSTGNGAVDTVTAYTIDAGITWYASFSQAYA